MEKEITIRLDHNWVAVAIDQLDDFGDVGYLEFKFLEKLLPHCTKQQLAHIERSTNDVDLTPITNKLWKKFFEMDFGGKTAHDMEMKKVSISWSKSYMEESKRMERAEKEAGERLKKRYEEEAGRKESKKIRVLDMVPPSSCNKRIRLKKESKPLMKKARNNYLNSWERRNLEAMKIKKTAACSGHIIKPKTTMHAMKSF